MSVKEDVETTIKELRAMAESLGMPLEQLLHLVTYRELVMVNQQLRALHDHYDMIEARRELKHE